MKVVIFIICLVLITGSRSRIIFPSGSDVGYLVSDTDENVSSEIESASKSRTVKRAFNNLLENIEFLKKKEIKDDRIPKGMEDKNHGVVMGVKNVECDDGMVNITIDWDNNPENHTCYMPKHRLAIRYDLEPYEHTDDVPPGYFPQHYCMFDTLEYNKTIPTFGPHRPLWPRWGEYVFVPRHRWLHALEHGAIVMLYHPCTEPTLVNELKSILTNCIYKHVISPYNLLPEDRPLTLVTWGSYLQMATIDKELVKYYIQERAKHGPEGHYAKLGKYTYGIVKNATVPNGSDEDDSIICP